MTIKFFDKLNQNKFLVVALIWVALWAAPWTNWLSPKWLRMGISMALFVLPGVIASILLVGKNLSLPAHLTSGTAFSVLTVSLLGVIGRAFNLPFAYIRPVFVLAGLAGLIALNWHSRSEKKLYKPIPFSILSLIILLLLMAVGSLTAMQSRFGGDDYSYLAYLTNWQHANPLDFNEVVMGSGNLDAFRFWLAMLPMNLAFIAEISKIHGLLLIGYYIEPMFMILAVVALYSLYEHLLKSEYLAGAAILLQFAFFFLLQSTQQPGNAILNRLSEDKAFAAFILAPSFFIAVNIFLGEMTFRNGLFTLLAGWSLALIHPILLAYSLFISIVYSFIVTITQKDRRKMAIIIALMLAVVAPVVPLRFVDVPSSPKSFELSPTVTEPGNNNILKTRITLIEGTPFYGFQLSRIQIVLGKYKNQTGWEVFSLSYLWILLVGFAWSLFNLKKKPIAPYMAATALLVLVCLIPYTGWLVGKIVTARMLWRSPWMLPIGIFGVVLLVELMGFIRHRINRPLKVSVDRAVLGIMLVASVLLFWFSLGIYGARWQRVESGALLHYRTKLSRFVAIGNYLEDNLESPSIFVGPQKLMSYFPGLSSKADVAVFRTYKYTSRNFSLERDPQIIRKLVTSDASFTVEQRIEGMKLYNIKYIIVDSVWVKHYYDIRPAFFSVKQVENLWLIELKDIAP